MEKMENVRGENEYDWMTYVGKTPLFFCNIEPTSEIRQLVEILLFAFIVCMFIRFYQNCNWTLNVETSFEYL